MINNEIMIEKNNVTRQLSADLKMNDWNQMFLKADPTKSIWFWLQETRNQQFLHGYIWTNDYVVSADPDLNVSGKWRNDYGGGHIQNFSQSGNKVTGTDDYGNTLTGTLSGNTLKGTWSRPGHSGRFTYDFASDGKSYTGKFSIGDVEPNIQSNGIKIS